MVLVSGYVKCVKLHHYMEAATASHGISQHTTLCSAIIPWRGTLIFTSSVVHINIFNPLHHLQHPRVSNKHAHPISLKVMSFNLLKQALSTFMPYYSFKCNFLVSEQRVAA